MFILSCLLAGFHGYRDLVCRGFKRCKSCMSQGTPQHSAALPDFSDPLEDIYCATLCSRMIYDIMAGLFVFVFVTGLNLTTIFCRHPVRPLTHHTHPHTPHTHTSLLSPHYLLRPHTSLLPPHTRPHRSPPMLSTGSHVWWVWSTITSSHTYARRCHGYYVVSL